nr:hypothetical protein CFP56_30871 [Quercus suber]
MSLQSSPATDTPRAAPRHIEKDQPCHATWLDWAPAARPGPILRGSAKVLLQWCTFGLPQNTLLHRSPPPFTKPQDMLCSTCMRVEAPLPSIPRRVHLSPAGA